MPKFRIISETREENGFLYEIEVEKRRIQVKFTFHSIERAKIWEIDIDLLLEALLYPEEVVTGHGGRFIAHRRHGEHLLRVIYQYEDSVPLVITVYFPYVERYFQGGGSFADKIFP